MRSVINATALICCLAVGAFAQGRSAGRTEGLPEVPTRPERSLDRPATRSSDLEHGHSSDRGTTAREDARKSGEREVSRQLTDNPGLTSAMKKMFPEGTDLGAMADGFDNLGHFVSAVHVSQNLGIPWDQLKTKIVTDDASLGKAIQALKPELSSGDVKAETRKAEEQAKKDIRGDHTN